MSEPSAAPSADLVLRSAISQVRLSGIVGWSLKRVDWSSFVTLVLEKDGVEFRIWVAPSSSNTGCFSETDLFKLGYQGEMPVNDGLTVIGEFVGMLKLRETNPALVESSGFTQDAFLPEKLVINKGELELRVTGSCNENCPFCNSSGWVDNRITDPAVVEKVILLAGDIGARSIYFTGGEPTLVGELPSWIRLTKLAGMRSVIQTNGIIFGSAEYWERFIDRSGRKFFPDELFVSFHTTIPERLQKITGREGGFPQKVNCIRFALDRGVFVTINFVIQTANIDELAGFPSYVVDTFGNQNISVRLSVVAPTGRACSRPELWPSMSDLSGHLRQALDSAAVLGLSVAVPPLCGVPVCVLPSHRKYFEIDSGRLSKEGVVLQDHVKSPRCSECLADGACIGVWRRYAEERGLDEFKPFREEVQPVRSDG